MTKSNKTLKSKLLSSAIIPASILAMSVSGAYATERAYNALPTGGQVRQGNATITQNATQMNIVQKTDKAVIDFRTFDVAKDHRVDFQQPSTSSSTLGKGQR